MRTSILSTAFVSVSLAAANAALITYDGFDYPAGQDLTAQAGWSASASGDSIVVASGNIGVTGLQAPTGNHITFGGGGMDATISIPSQSTDVYYSLAFRVTDASALDATGGYVASFRDSSALLGSLVWLRSHGPDRFDIGLSVRPNSSLGWNTNAGNGFQLNRTIFLIASYQHRTGSGNNVANMWLNVEPFPGSGTFGGPAPASAGQQSGGPDLDEISGFTLTQYSATGTPVMQVDELRIGHSYGEVTPVPEPSPAVILAGAGLLPLLLRRRGGCGH